MTQPSDRAYAARGALRVALYLVCLYLLFARPALAVGDDSPSPSPSTTSSISPSSSVSLVPFSITATSLPSMTPTPAQASSHTPDLSSPTIGPPASPSPSASPSASVAPASPTATPASTEARTYPKGSVLISEVAWSGTRASAHDEWIELFNPGAERIEMDGWILTDHDDITIHLTISIAPFSFTLLERTDDSTVANIPADQIYTGSLKNSGDALALLDPAGKLVDSANATAGTWPAGESGTRTSMERRGGDDRPGNWATFLGYGGVGVDAAGNPIAGTPREINSIHLPQPSPESSGTAPAVTPTPSVTYSPSPPVAFAPGSVLISEVAWAGTRASASDEWIELHNPGERAIALDGWILHDGGDLYVALSGTLLPRGFFLLERSNDQSIASIPADQIYSGALSNSGETLSLLSPGGNIIDSANIQGGSWPAGDHQSRASMERRGGDDRPGNWGSFTGYHGCGVDAAGQPIQGSPRQVNSIQFPTPQPTWIPGKIVINEILIRPHYDWEGIGGVDTGDEFIELLNLGPRPVNLRDWLLDDGEATGSKPYSLPSHVLHPGQFHAFFRSRTHIALNDTGDIVRLLDPALRVVDEVAYLRVRAYNLSYGRLPDGSGHLVYGLWPTPGQPNLLFEDPAIHFPEPFISTCWQTGGFRFPLIRVLRTPQFTSHYSSRGLRLCWYQGGARGPQQRAFERQESVNPMVGQSMRLNILLR